MAWVVVFVLEERLVRADHLCVLAEPGPDSPAQVDDALNPLGGQEGVAQNLLGLLAYAVNAARTLDETDDGPGQVVVHNDMGVLKVLALAQDVGGDHDAKLPLRFALARPLVTVWAESPCQLSGVGGTAGDARHVRNPSVLELRFQVINRVGELGEHQRLPVRRVSVSSE